MRSKTRRGAPASRRIVRIASKIALVGAAVSTVYRRAIKPWQHRWGATDEEVKMIMPGDELVEKPKFNTTRAVTINAPPEDVWPWLAQMGQGRGGLYTYDWLENLAGLDIHSIDWVVPEMQDLKVGDVIPLSPDGMGPVVKAVEPNKLLVTAANQDEMSLSWVWHLRDLKDGRTRLVARWRAHFDFGMMLNKETLNNLKKSPWPTLASLLVTGLLDIGEFIMERGMLIGIKKRAEHLAAG